MPLMWPTLTVQDVERSLSFYRDQLGLEQDLDLRDETGALYLASVEVHETGRDLVGAGVRHYPDAGRQRHHGQL
jgi:catechol 2,3-dioxygenase-like lactoylglutathione lyase family enzyme